MISKRIHNIGFCDYFQHVMQYLQIQGPFSYNAPSLPIILVTCVMINVAYDNMGHVYLGIP
jgi:hypothetical protein